MCSTYRHPLMTPIKLHLCSSEETDKRAIKKILNAALNKSTVTLTLGIIVDAIKNACADINWHAEVKGHFIKSDLDTLSISDIISASRANVVVQEDLFCSVRNSTFEFYQKFTLKQSSNDSLESADAIYNLECGSLIDIDDKINIILTLADPAAASVAAPVVAAPVAPAAPAAPAAAAAPVAPMAAIPQADDGSFDIFVKTLTGSCIVVRVTSATTSAELKDLIDKSQGVPPHRQRIVFAGKQIEDGHTIGNLRIQRESTIHMVLNLRGGMYHVSSSRIDYCSANVNSAKADEGSTDPIVFVKQLRINFLCEGEKKLLISLWIHPKCKIATIRHIIQMECDETYFNKLTSEELCKIDSRIASMLSREALSRLYFARTNKN